MKEKKNIYHIIASPLDSTGGISSITRKIASNLKLRGYRNRFITFSSTYTHFIEREIYGFSTYIIPLNGSLIKRYFRLYLIIKNFFIKKKEVISLIHIHAHIYPGALISSFLSKILKIPTILSLHGGVQINQVRIHWKDYFINLMKWIYYWIQAILICSLSDVVTSDSQSDIGMLYKLNFIIKKKIQYIPNGIDISSQKIMNFEKRIYVTFIGRLTYLKGFHIFIKIVKILLDYDRNMKLSIVGNGNMAYLIKSELDPKLHINYEEYVSDDELIDLYQKSKLLIFPSLSEGFPLVLIEAMYYHVPIIASDIRANKDLIENGINGYLFKIDDITDAVKKALLIINNEEKQVNFGAISHKIIISKYNMEKIILKYISIYRNLMNFNYE